MRRIHVNPLSIGQLVLPAEQAHHLRDVLRLGVGDRVELFDDIGQTASATIARCGPDQLIVDVSSVATPAPGVFRWTIASAIPKGSRADWMIEKLSELGTAAFVPLAAARSVVLPEGKSKLQRWQRIASESASQSHRNGVMRIDPLTPLDRFVKSLAEPAWCLSTAPGALSIAEAPSLHVAGSLTLLIGPEGGWTTDELDGFTAAGLTPITLGATILRVETAAVAAAAIAAAILAPAMGWHPPAADHKAGKDT